ncbi:MAG: sialidase family protein [Actinomycetota bacterium]|nr:sialidase family protein [Actinomycetota bacterium]
MNIEDFLRSAAGDVPPAVTLDEVRARARRTTEPTTPVPLVDVGDGSEPPFEDETTPPQGAGWGARPAGPRPVRTHRRLAVAAVGLVVAGLSVWSPWADGTGDDSVVAGKPDDESPGLIVSGRDTDTSDTTDTDVETTEDTSRPRDATTTTVDDGATTSVPAGADVEGGPAGGGATTTDRSTTTAAPSTRPSPAPTKPTPTSTPPVSPPSTTSTTAPATTSTTTTPTTVPFDATIPAIDRSPVAETWAGQPVGEWTNGGSLPGSVEAYDECGIIEHAVTVGVLEHLSDGIWAIAATTDPSIVGPELAGSGVWRSRDGGASWSTVEGLSFSSNMEVLVCNGTPTDGVPTFDGHPRAIAELGGRVVIGGEVYEDGREPTVWTSTPDGSRWRAITLPAPDARIGYAVVGLAATDAGIVALGNPIGSSGPPIAWWSSDGYQWTQADTGTMTRSDRVVDVAVRGNRIVAVGSVDPHTISERPVAWTSTNGGRSWTRAGLPGRSAEDGLTEVTAVAAGPQGFLAVGNIDEPNAAFDFDAVAWTSADGSSWTLAAAFAAPDHYSLALAVASTSSGFVVTGVEGATRGEASATAWLTTNGTPWTAIPPNRHQSSLNVAEAGSGAVIVTTPHRCGGNESCGFPREPMVARRVRTG